MALEIVGVSKVFEKQGESFEVLRDINLTIEQGDFVTLIGPSGCGKTTLLKIIEGLTPPTRGEIRLNGKVSAGPSPEKAFVFQHFNLFPWRNLVDNVAFGLEIQGVEAKERRDAAKTLLKSFNLGGFFRHYPTEISGGMQQRVGLARALIMNPRLLLMDEPLGALDALTRETLQEELLRACARVDSTVIFVTHSIDEAIYLSDRILVMSTRPGRIVRDVRVNLPKPRWEYNIRKEAEYPRLREELWNILREVAA